MAGKWGVISHSPYLVVKSQFSMYQNLANTRTCRPNQLTTLTTIPQLPLYFVCHCVLVWLMSPPPIRELLSLGFFSFELRASDQQALANQSTGIAKPLLYVGGKKSSHEFCIAASLIRPPPLAFIDTVTSSLSSLVLPTIANAAHSSGIPIAQRIIILGTAGLDVQSRG